MNNTKKPMTTKIAKQLKEEGIIAHLTDAQVALSNSLQFDSQTPALSDYDRRMLWEATEQVTRVLERLASNESK